LLGLTATPGRTDRADILALCDNNLVYERGLFEGVATELLCPFRYYGIGDHEVDYQAIPWRNGKFDPEALTNQLATVARAKHVIDSWRERKQKRTLAFCVSIRHADFMAEYFLSRSVRAASIHSRSERGRSQALAELEAGELDVVFSVDLFNEGVDLPAIDTVLMLRPTESQILFMQQLGRGLRRCPEVGKEHLVVVDFIGNHISFFRKMEAMHAIAATNQGRREFVEKIEAKQLSLPSGCFVNYDAKAIEFMKLLVQATGAKQRDRYCALFESLGRRPSMQEFHVAGGGLAAVRKEYGQWHSLVEQEGHLNTKQTEVFKANKSVLLHLETSSMTKSYKMVLLEAFSDLDGFSSPPTLGALAKRSFDIIRRRRQLWPDLPDLFRASFEDYEGIEKEWMGYWRKNPVRAWLGEKTQGDFAYFELRDDQFCYALELEQSHVEVLDELVTEVLDYRLQAYEERLASALDLIELVDAEEDTGVDIPYFSDLRIACGYFRSSEHESANVEFRRLPGRYGHLNPDRHFIARASGNSMDGGRSPVKDGDYLLLEMMSPDSAGSITGQVLAVEREDVSGDDQYVLRKVTKRADGTYVLVANNPDYQDFVATEEMRTIARFKSVIDPRDLALRTELMREDIPGLFGLAFNRGAWEAGHVCPKVISDQILLITLNKQGKQSEHQYHDYFLGPDTFHWQSQNSTIPTNKRGLGIINHEANGSAIHLFVRKTKLRAKTASPFYYLGQAVYESHKNSGPMDVIFKLKEPLSAGLAQYFGTTEHDA
jgi:SOS-response transcriptional repressor LexA